jgi:hypothetical protein
MPPRRNQSLFWLLSAVAVFAMFGLAFRPYLTARFRGHGARLAGVDLSGTNLRGVDLGQADLRRAVLAGADLRGANLAGADLRAGRLQSAFLQGADLQGADLENADLRTAVMTDANLAGANLTGTILACCHDEKRSTDLRGARYDVRTRWPDGFIPDGHGARKFSSQRSAVSGQ